MASSQSSSNSRTVRVFLSSTFRDFAEERDLLVRKVFPELRRKCRERQVELVDVDLRWGITEEEAQQGKVLPICMAEIDRARPYFIGFLGERYGWVPEQHQYDLSLVLEQPWLDEHRGGKSVTELEMLHGVLNNPAMEDRAFFYFRDPDYSNSKGEAYLSESPEDKAKLEELKDRIRKSGFPVVENYASPEALAERVKQDIWKLIDDAFPESKIPDALDLERRRHEIYSASRQGMYIGGEAYFAALDQAMAAQVRKPVLVTGASGGGKSALLANWSRSYSSQHPKTIVLEHYLATGADSAEAIGMVTRLLKEIARITGEDLVLEGDPRKALHLFNEWLGKAGAFARQQGGELVLVLDGLDKMTGGGGLDWWPHQLPDGVGLVVSCLPGLIFDAAANRMTWDQVVVAPLGREDCQSFINSYLEKFRKPLPPELVELVLQHPLSGNPLFLRTLLEEMRVFGVHELLRQRLEHYLASGTVDDLFERVLERVEADNRAEDVRAVLEVLWAAKESFAEDELLEISGLPPAVWAPIHIALDDSLIGAGGRLAFSHDYLRKAVEDRYLPSAEARRHIQNRMAEFCAQAMAGGRKDISHYIRRHAVEHFLEFEDWGNATAALSDLEFIEARAIAQELPAMLMDYAEAVKLLPEGEKERQADAARQADLDRYTKEMVEYAARWSRIRDGSGEAEPSLPTPVESVRLWTDEEIAAECKRMTETPNRLDIVNAFRVFVATNSTPLQKYSTQEGFAANLSRNDAAAGPVHDEGKRRLKPLNCIKLIRKFEREAIYNPLPACQAILEGHEGEVTSVAVSSDGRTMISSSDDKTLRIWSAENYDCLKVLRGHEEAVRSVSLSIDGHYIASGGRDKAVRMWDAHRGLCLRVFEGHAGEVNSVAVSFDGRRVVSGSNDKTVRVWDAESGECLRAFNSHTSYVLSVALTRDGRRVVSGSNDKTVRVWDAESGECLNVLDGHEKWIASVAFNCDGRFIVSGSNDKTVRVWDAESGECLKILRGHEEGVCCVALDGSGKRICSSAGGYRGLDQTVRVWNAERGLCPGALQKHTESIRALSISPNKQYFVSGSQDKTLRLWDAKSGKCLKTFEGHTSYVLSAVFCSHAMRFVSGSYDKTLRLWDAKSGKCLTMLEGHRYAIYGVDASSDGLYCASASEDSTLRLWAQTSGDCLRILEGHKRGVYCVAISVDCRQIVSGGSGSNTLRIWDVETGLCCLVLKGHEKSIRAVALSPDGRRIVSGGDDRMLRLWDARTGKCLSVLRGHDARVGTVAFSADGQLIVSSSRDKVFCVWDARSGRNLFKSFVPGLTVFATDWGRSRLVMGFSDGRVEIVAMQNLRLGPVISTAQREIISEEVPAGLVTTRTGCCGQLFSIPTAIADRIEHWSIDGGEGGYTDPVLLIDCPFCRNPLRMNPFFVDVKTSSV